MATLRPEDITVVIDTREKTPLKFPPGIKTVVKGLVTGDYSVLGLEKFIAVERKNLADLLACVGSDRRRFDEELHRLMAFDARAVVVEASRGHVLMGNGRSRVDPKAVEGSLVAWSGKIHFEFASNPEQAARYVAWFLWLHARRRYDEVKPFLKSLKG